VGHMPNRLARGSGPIPFHRARPPTGPPGARHPTDRGGAPMEPIHVEDRGRIRVVTIDRPERRNAVDRATAEALWTTFMTFDGDDRVDVAVLTGSGGNFCSGADLKAIADGHGNLVTQDGPG